MAVRYLTQHDRIEWSERDRCRKGRGPLDLVAVSSGGQVAWKPDEEDWARFRVFLHDVKLPCGLPVAFDQERQQAYTDTDWWVLTAFDDAFEQSPQSQCDALLGAFQSGISPEVRYPNKKGPCFGVSFLVALVVGFYVRSPAILETIRFRLVAVVHGVGFQRQPHDAYFAGSIGRPVPGSPGTRLVDATLPGGGCAHRCTRSVIAGPSVTPHRCMGSQANVGAGRSFAAVGGPVRNGAKSLADNRSRMVHWPFETGNPQSPGYPYVLCFNRPTSRKRHHGHSKRRPPRALRESGRLRVPAGVSRGLPARLRGQNEARQG